MVLAYRKKTGCKQYVFDDVEKMILYFSKKAYLGETIHYHDYDDDGCLFKQGFFHVTKVRSLK